MIVVKLIYNCNYCIHVAEDSLVMPAVQIPRKHTLLNDVRIAGTLYVICRRDASREAESVKNLGAIRDRVEVKFLDGLASSGTASVGGLLYLPGSGQLIFRMLATACLNVFENSLGSLSGGTSVTSFPL